MKFSQIKIGDKFIWKNDVYSKTSPIVAKNIETNANKIIPKYVTIGLVDSVTKDESTIESSDDLLSYFVKKLNKKITSSTLSDTDKEFVLEEINTIKQDVMKRIQY